MGRITFRRREELVARRPIDDQSPERLAQLSEGEANSRRRRFFPATEESLELFEIELDPGAIVRPHAHSSPEVIYVTSGELRFGSRVCGPGTAIFVDAYSLYGFRAGQDGASFLNFRGEPGPSYLTTADLRQSSPGA